MRLNRRNFDFLRLLGLALPCRPSCRRGQRILDVFSKRRHANVNRGQYRNGQSNVDTIEPILSYDTAYNLQPPSG